MRFLLSLLLLCSVTAQAQIHGGFPWYRPTPKGNNFRLRNANIVVSAGANQSVTNQTFTLSGGGTNLSFPSHPLSWNWSLVSPFESVQIVSATSSNTVVSVTNNNVSYVFELTGQDTPYFGTDRTTVNVSTPNPITNQPPSITVIGDQTVLENTATNAHWIWSDDTTLVGASSYILSSSNPNLVPNGNLVLDGSKTNLTITPLTHSNGVATISVTPVDAQLLPGVTRQFAFNVLATNDPPTISTPAPQSTLQNTPVAVPFVVGDIETSPGNLLSSASSSDLSKVLNSQIVLSGSGANRVATITPVTNAFGTVTITIRASDGLIVTSTSFVLTITHVNQAPTLAAIPDSTTLQDTALTLPLDAQDIDSTLTTASFSCTASSNPGLIGTGNVIFSGVPGAFTLTATPLAGQTGSSTLTVQVSDGSLTASRSFVLTVVSSQFTLPTDRSAPWSLAGIPGGIPVVSSQFCNVKLSIPGSALTAKGDGITDDTSAIAAALANCPSNQFVLFPAGTYINNAATTVMRPGVVLRGAGMNSSRIIGGPIYFPVNFGAKEVNMFGSGVVLAKGSSNVVVTTVALPSSDSPSLVPFVGMYMTIGVTNDNVLIDPLGTGGNWRDVFGGFENKNLAQMAQITAISNGTNITFWPPSLWNYSNSLGVVVRYYSTLTTRAGIEDICLESPSPHTQQHMIRMNGAAYCWLKNVKINWAYEDAVYIAEAFRCNIEGCWWQYTLHADSSGGYGTRFTETVPSWNKVQDNIVEGFRDPIIFEGGSGNVSAYNYAPWATNFDGSTQHALSSHASSPVFNLFEGNKTWSSGADDTHGSSIYNTYFRNFLWGISPLGATPGGGPSTQYNWVNRLDRKALYYSYVGNVFGTPGQPGVYESSSVIGTGTRSANTRYIWTLGYVTDGSGNTNSSGGFAYDPNVRITLLRTNNYDYINNATVDAVNITASLYLANKPAFFGALTWPPIGPQVTGKTNIIPAEERYMARVSPSFTVTDKAGAVSTPVNWTLAATAQDEFWTAGATSSNPGLIPSGNIVFSGVGNLRNVVMTPVSGQSGTSTVTVTVANQNLSTSHTLVYTVASGNAPPTITGFANQSITQNTSTAALAFTVADPDTPVASLTNGKISSNATLVPLFGIVFGGGTGANRTVQITPATGQTGSATITVTVSDGISTVGTSFVLTVTNASFHTWFVRPPPHPAVYSGGNYVPMGTGTQADPFDLFYAGDGAGGQIQPGDICWLLGDSHFGQYLDVFQPTVNATAVNPIIFRNWNHEKVTINTLRGYPQVQGKKQGQDQSDSLAWNPKGNYIWLWGVELTSTNLVATNRISTQTGGDTSNPTDLGFTGAIDVGAVPSDTGPIGIGSRFIHCFPNNLQQNGFWQLADDTETYGCLSQYPGWQGPDRGHGHNFYVQAEGPIGKRFLYNVAFSGNANGMQVFGKAATTFTQNIIALGNVTLDNGELGSSGYASGFLLYTGGNAARNCGVFSNIFYYPHGTSPSADFGGPGESGTGVQNVTAAWNIITSRMKLNLGPGPFAFTNNTCYVNDFSTAAQGGLEGLSTATYPNNTYTTSRPPQTNVVFKTDAYEAKRGMVVCMWNTAGGAVTVTPADLAKLGYVSGDSVELCSASDVRIGHALFSGTWVGGNISIPLSSISLAPVIGGSTHPPSNPTTDIVALYVTNGYHAF